MGTADFFIIAVVLALALASGLWLAAPGKRKGCSGNCVSCRGCDSEIRKKA